MTCPAKGQPPFKPKPSVDQDSVFGRMTRDWFRRDSLPINSHFSHRERSDAVAARSGRGLAKWNEQRLVSFHPPSSLFSTPAAEPTTSPSRRGDCQAGDQIHRQSRQQGTMSNYSKTAILEVFRYLNASLSNRFESPALDAAINAGRHPVLPSRRGYRSGSLVSDERSVPATSSIGCRVITT